MGLFFKTAKSTSWQAKLSPENQRYLEESVILHEFVHLLTTVTINRVNREVATTKEKQIVKKLEKLKDHTFEALMKSSPETVVAWRDETKTLGDLFGNNWATEKSRRDLVKNVIKKYISDQSLTEAEAVIIYPLIGKEIGHHAIDEFLPGTTNSKTLVSFMMQQKIPSGYQEGQGLFDTLMKLLADLVSLFNKENPLADKAVKNSTFEAALTETMNLISIQEAFYEGDTTEVVDSEFIKDEEEEVEEEEPTSKPRFIRYGNEIHVNELDGGLMEEFDTEAEAIEGLKKWNELPNPPTTLITDPTQPIETEETPITPENIEPEAEEGPYTSVINGVTLETGSIKLSGDQEIALQKMADFVDQDKARIFSLRGYAGTGKTTIVKFLMQYIGKSKGRYSTVVLGTPTHKANAVLDASMNEDKDSIGINNVKKANTLASLLQNKKTEDPQGRTIFVTEALNANRLKKDLPEGSYVILDEASMIQASQINTIMDLAKKRDLKIITMGDPMQLPPPSGANRLSVALFAKNDYELTEVKRQEQGNPALETLGIIRTNKLNVVDQFKHQTAINKKGEGIEWVKTEKEFDEAINEYMNNPLYKDNISFTKIIAYTNAKVHALNQTARLAAWGKDAVTKSKYITGEPIMGYSDSGNITNNGDYQILDASEIVNTSQKETDINLWGGSRQVIQNHMDTVGMSQSIDDLKFSGIHTKMKQRFTPQIEKSMKERGNEPQEFDTIILDLHSNALGNKIVIDTLYRLEKLKSDIWNMPVHPLTGQAFSSEQRIARGQKYGAATAIDEQIEDIKAYFQFDQEVYQNKPLKDGGQILPKSEAVTTWSKAFDGGRYKGKNFGLVQFNKSVDYGYAITAHKSQGSTYTNVLIDWDNMERGRNIINDTEGNPYMHTRNSLKYVALSRASQRAIILSNKTEAGTAPTTDLEASDPVEAAGINDMTQDPLSLFGETSDIKESPFIEDDSLGDAKKKTVYAGAFISKPTHTDLLKKFPAKHKNVYMDHSTIQFRPDQNTLNGLPYQGTIEMTVTGIVEDEKGQALIVDNPHALTKYPHITVSTAEGVSSKYSNEMIKKAIKDKTIKLLPEPITIKAKVGLVMKDGNIWYSKDPAPKATEKVITRDLTLAKIEKGYGLLNLSGGKKLFTSQIVADKRVAKIEKENPGVTARVINDGDRGYIVVLTDNRETEGNIKRSPIAKGKKVDAATRLIISSLENQIAGLKRRIARASSLDYKEPTAPLEKRIVTINEQIDELLKKQTSAETLKIAQEQLRWATKLLAKRGTISQLDTIIKVIKSWQGVMDRVTRETEFSGYDFGDIATLLHNLETNWTKSAQSLIGEMVQKGSGLDLSIKEIFGPQFDAGWFSSQARGAFSSQVPIIRVVDKWLQEAVIRAGNEFEGYVREINSEIAKLEVSPGNLKEKFDKLSQKGKDGKPTGNLISKIQIEYFQELGKRRSAVRKAGKSTRASNLAYKKHIRWLYGENGLDPNVIHIDINELTDGKEIYDPRYSVEDQKIKTAAEIAAYKEKLIKAFMAGDASKKESATEIVNALIEQQKEKFQNYLQNRKEMIEDYEVKYEDDAAAQLNSIRKWEGQNNPFYYNEQIENVIFGDPLPSGFSFRYNFATQYVPSMPAPKHWDPEFDKVMQDPALKKFYQYYVETMEKLWAYLPDNSDISKNRIPDLVKDLTEKYSDSALRGIAAGLNNSLVGLITDKTEAEVSYGTIDPETGLAMPSIPLWMTGDSLMAEQKSYDLGKILKAFAAMATNYKHKARVEPQVLLANRLLGSIKEAIKTESGGKQVDSKDDLMRVNKGLTKSKAQLQYTIESLLYGMTKEPGTPVKVLGKQTGFMTTEAKEQFKVVKEANETFKEALKKGTPYTEAYSDYTEAIKKLPSKVKSFIYSDLNKREEFQKTMGNEEVLHLTDDNIKNYDKVIEDYFQKPVTGQSIGNALITYTQALGMGFNWFSATANLVFGTSAVFRHAAGKSEYTPGNARKAFTIMMGSTINGGKYSPTQSGKKVRALMENFDGLAQVVESMYGSEESRSQNWLYLLQERSEFFVYGQILVAMMQFNKVTDKDGNEKSLWDAFDENGDWKAKEFPLKDNEGWDKFSKTEKGSEAWIKFKRKYDGVAKKVHGNYDRKSPILGKKQVLGRLLFQFRSWVPELWFDRWEDQRWDEALERYSKGTWRTYGTALESTGVKGFASMMIKQFGLQMLGKDASQFEDLSEIDQINMRKNIAELYFVAALSIALWLLGQIELEGDDDETLYMNMGMTLLLNTFNRVNTEVTFFINPDAMLQMTKGNPAPAIGTLSNLLIDIPSALLKQLSGEGEYKTGVRKGHNRLLKESLELIPLGNQYYKFHYMTHTKMAN